MLDALNAIVEFLNSIVSTVATFIRYIGVFFSFIVKGGKFLYQCISFIPVEYQAIGLLVVVLTVVLLIVGRSNKNG